MSDARLVVAGHPAMEGELVVGVIGAAARHDGLRWDQILVVVPSHASTDARSASIRAAARRASVPMVGGCGHRLTGPLVDAVRARVTAERLQSGRRLRLVDCVGTALDDLLGRRLHDDPAVMALATDLLRHAHELDARHPDPFGPWADHLATGPRVWTRATPTRRNAARVTTASVAAQLLDRTRPVDASGPVRLVVLTGLVDGVWPRLGNLAEDRQRFEAVTRRAIEADAMVVAVAAPDAGRLVSRFVDDWPRRPGARPERALDLTRFPLGIGATGGGSPIWPERSLRLSATQLAAYENCPWNHALQYAASVRSGSGLSARFGSLVHDILDRFLAGPELSLEGLLSLADGLWDPAIAPYRPQAEDYRTRLDALLRAWWEQEGIPLNTDRERVVATERRFTMPVGAHTLTGSIDRIDRLDDGLEVIDYKTGATPATHAEAARSIQLAIYHLAASTDPELQAIGPVRRLELRYLAGAEIQTRTQPILPDHAQITEGRIVELAGRILDEHVAPSPAADCQFCDLHRLCPRQQQGRPLTIRSMAAALPTTSPNGERWPGDLAPIAQRRAAAPRSGGNLSPNAVELTDEQRCVVDAPAGPLLVVAGAGSGKTTVIAERVVALTHSGIDPVSICALTFSNKGAGNLRERIVSVGASTLGDAIREVTVATYHAFAAWIVMGHLADLGLPHSSRLLATGQSTQLALDVFDRSPWVGNKTGRPIDGARRSLALGDRAANHLVDLDRIRADADALLADDALPEQIHRSATVRAQLLSLTESARAERMRRGLLDHADEIRLAVELLRSRPEAADDLRRRFSTVVLDEYQDTDVAQRELLRLIWPVGGSVTAVGDPVQAIYGFRGAHPANLDRFVDDFGAPPALPLQQNHRCAPPIDALTRRVRTVLRPDEPSTAVDPTAAPDGSILCVLLGDDADEAAWIAGHVTRLGAGGAAWSDVAVLCRKRRLIRPIVDALTAAGVPVEVVGIGGLLQRPEIVEIMAWLEVLALPRPTVATLRLLMGPRTRLGLADVAALARAARAARAAPSGATPHDRPTADAPGLLDGIELTDVATGLSSDGWTRVKRFLAERSELGAAAAELPLGALVEHVVELTGLWGALDDRGTENLVRFQHIADTFEPIGGTHGLREFLEWLSIVEESEEELPEAVAGDTDAVRVMTIHQAKGLEFDHVIVPGLAGSGRSTIFPDERLAENPTTQGEALPWWLRMDDEGFPAPPRDKPGMDRARQHARDAKRAEEWRLFYVALTRARLTLACTAAHWYAGTAQAQGPSELNRWLVQQTDLVVAPPPQPSPTEDPRVRTDRARTAAADPAAAMSATPAPSTPSTPSTPRRIGRAGAQRPGQGTLLDLVPSAVPDPLDALSPIESVPVSGLVSFARCPRQFDALYVRGIPRRPHPAAALGTEIHRWIEERGRPQRRLFATDDTETRDTETNDPADDIVDDTTDEPDDPTEVIQQVVGEGAGGRRPSLDELRGGLRRSFLASPYAAIDPLHVEASVVVSLGAIGLRGRIDAAYLRDGLLDVVDFKTGRQPDPGDGGAAVQLEAYALAAVDQWGHDADSLSTSYVYLRHDSDAIIDSTRWDRGAVGDARVRLHRLADGITAGRRAPSPGSWCASCDALQICPEGRRALRGDDS